MRNIDVDIRHININISNIEADNPNISINIRNIEADNPNINPNISNIGGLTFLDMRYLVENKNTKHSFILF